jgi:cytoskeletal protein RodZ
LAGILLLQRQSESKLMMRSFLMRYVTSTIAAVALAGAVSVFAQEQQAPSQPPPNEQAPAEQTTPKSTLTGCVVQAKTTDGGSVYVLSKAEGGSATMYILAGSNESEFSGNVNKKIEVTGPVQEPPPSTEKESAPASNVVRPPAVRVESVKVVAESCS